MYIITHRGLDPSMQDFFVESSLEALENHIERGFGLEFDLQATKDNKFVVFHDNNLKRISQGENLKKILDYTEKELCLLKIKNCHIASFTQILDMIEKNTNNNTVHFVHIKYFLQSQKYLDILLEYIKNRNINNIIFFDIKIDTGKYLKGKNKKINLAPSVSHKYDIKRYGKFVGNTLLTTEVVLKNKALFNWVWLDEWDLLDKNNGTKKLYTEKTFTTFRDFGFNIALVTPELHASSPSLLGKEAHQDVKTAKKLQDRLQEIITLAPDAVCTDYPDLIKNLITI
ncbi:hypothetical protein COW81_03265 [Candidatus Campbellbacteria bacterium CG22_combo_CG10-13_8_21_14_all_36_13]|uniref:GP-PDE domain-containing protein n=1 Tax=Candidatus Campbellbacteria bacterium CG22_combo_CG10-13_8_21_14_all_36_13 TaxID=1974529 RepID=A0A2H0DXF6_9BACT|nr:MAG: hypothetical protein COW81_03265 [Candidatus Campbellbacteria bacterium CG22_combo_CG10-13_8_21_14_all_36_13]